VSEWGLKTETWGQCRTGRAKSKLDAHGGQARGVDAAW